MPKRLCLSRTNKVLAGVCGGLSEYIGVDATLVRIIWVLASIMTMAVPLMVIYVVCWAIMPLEDR